MKAIIFLFTFFLAFNYTNAQDTTAVRRSGFAFNYMPLPAYGGINYEILLANRLNVEAGVGLFGIGGGLNYYALKPKIGKISPFIGLKSNWITMIHARTQVVSYMPVGATLFGELLFLSLDFGPAIYDIKGGSRRDDQQNRAVIGLKEFGFNGNIKFGIRFQIFDRKNIKKPWNDLFI